MSGCGHRRARPLSWRERSIRPGEAPRTHRRGVEASRSPLPPREQRSREPDHLPGRALQVGAASENVAPVHPDDLDSLVRWGADGYRGVIFTSRAKADG